MSLEHQDWKPVIVRTKQNNTTSQVNQYKSNPYQQKAKSIEKKADNDELKHKEITILMRQSIQKGRAAKGFTQKQLAQKCGVTVKIINDIESGKAIYNHNHLNKIRKHLGIKF